MCVCVCGFSSPLHRPQDLVWIPSGSLFSSILLCLLAQAAVQSVPIRTVIVRRRSSIWYRRMALSLSWPGRHIESCSNPLSLQHRALRPSQLSVSHRPDSLENLWFGPLMQGSIRSDSQRYISDGVSPSLLSDYFHGGKRLPVPRPQ